MAHTAINSVRLDCCTVAVAARAFRMFCSTTSPNLGSARTFPARAACSRSLRLRTPSASNSTLTRFGPRPGSAVSASSSTGYFCLISS